MAEPEPAAPLPAGSQSARGKGIAQAMGTGAQATVLTGPVAHGNYNYQLQIGSVHGDVVNIAQPVSLRLRAAPARLLPKPFDGLLDRRAEVDDAATALGSGRPVEFVGEAGLGKSVLLRYLAHHPPAGDFAHGIVCIDQRRPVADLLQFLFEQLYECEPPVPYKPTDGELRRLLQDRRVLVVVDDVELPREDVEALLNAAPRCTFLLASTDRHLWGEGLASPLDGLPPADAVALLERGLGRALSAEERAAAEQLCTALEGHPLRLLQAAALVAVDGRRLAEVARDIHATSPAESLTAQILAPVDDKEQRLLATLAAAFGAPLGGSYLAAVTGLADAPTALSALEGRGLVEAGGERYRLAGSLGDALRQGQDPGEGAGQTLSSLVAWADQHRSTPGDLLEESDVIMRALEWGVRAGRWPEVLRLSRAVEAALAVDRRWEARAQVLDWGLQAARGLGALPAQAWALHQLGTRALCLGEAEAARPALQEALRLRESVGDEAGAAVTRHNLGFMPFSSPPMASRPAPPSAPTARPMQRPIPPVAVGATGVLGRIIRMILIFGLGGLGTLLGALLVGLFLLFRDTIPAACADHQIAPSDAASDELRAKWREFGQKAAVRPETINITEVQATSLGADKTGAQVKNLKVYFCDEGYGEATGTVEIARRDVNVVVRGTLDWNRPKPRIEIMSVRAGSLPDRIADWVARPIVDRVLDTGNLRTLDIDERSRLTSIEFGDGTATVRGGPR
jgi:hypothetical protein